MPHTPYGYRIENGVAVIDDAAAEKLKKLYANYISGMALRTAAKEAGIDTYHGTAGRMMETRHYLGDDFYPAIIDADVFNRAHEERLRRAAALGRLNKVTQKKTRSTPTHFYFLEIEKHFDLPAKQAQYMYSRIECEVI